MAKLHAAVQEKARAATEKSRAPRLGRGIALATARAFDPYVFFGDKEGKFDLNPLSLLRRAAKWAAGGHTAKDYVYLLTEAKYNSDSGKRVFLHDYKPSGRVSKRLYITKNDAYISLELNLVSGYGHSFSTRYAPEYGPELKFNYYPFGNENNEKEGKLILLLRGGNNGDKKK
jgi:hypothetical protein